MKRVLRILLPHAVVILALMFLILLVLHEFNPFMNFIGSNVSRMWLLIFCLLSLTNGILSITEERKRS